MNERKIILDLCGGTGAWSLPYREAGYDVRVITLPDHDVRTYEPPEGVYGILAAPPCTQFSFARQRYKTPPDFKGALEAVDACMRIIRACQLSGHLKFWALENPVGHLRKFLGRPQYTFRQWQFGGYHVKPTDIWGWFDTPKPTHRKRPDISGDELMKRWSNPKIPKEIAKQFPTTKERRAAVRAITPEGFARAFYKANK